MTGEHGICLPVGMAKAIVGDFEKAVDGWMDGWMVRLNGEVRRREKKQTKTGFHVLWVQLS